MTGRTLVAGVGNVFLGDDGFGVEVAARLAEHHLPAGVEVADFGIRGVHLAYQLLEGYDLLVLVDALARGEPAGTLTVFEPVRRPTAEPQVATAALLDAHGMQPDLVLGLLDVLAASDGGNRAVARVVVVGCEPAALEDGMGLSDPVAAAVPAAVDLVLELLDEEGEGHGQVDHRRVGAGSRGGGLAGGQGHEAVLQDPEDVS
ncbi:MAG: hydrogenase maturation protease [Actinomycetes bacterium]